MKRLLILALSALLGSSCATQPGRFSQYEVAQADTLPAPPPDTTYVRVPPRQPGPYRAERTRHFDLLHTRLDVSFDWERQHLLGEALLTLKPYFYPRRYLTLDAKGFDINSVTLVADTAEVPLRYNYQGVKLDITLDSAYTRYDTLTLRIDYVAKPNELTSGGSAAISDDRGLYFINPTGADPNKPRQIWTQGETEASSCWFPTIDSPNERCTQEMYITVDSQFVTLSNGALVYATDNGDGTRTDYWSQELPHAPYLFMMAIGEYAVVHDTWRDLAVDYYVEPTYEPYADDIFGNTPAMLEFFSEKLGVPFPWDKYAQVVVRDFVSGAMENTSASTFMEDVQSTDRELLDRHWDGIIAHELFHQWFGDLVTCESWSNIPLNEAFANYGEYLWFEHYFGLEEADYHALEELGQYLREAQRKRVPMIRYYYDQREDMFDSHSYARGGRVLHMLRKYVGDEAFFASLQRYLVKNAYTAVEIDELRLAFEDVTGEDLHWFFDQWFMQAGHPELSVSHAYADGQLTLRVRQEQDTLRYPVYKLPLDVAVWTDEQPRRFSIVVDEVEETFALPVAQQPDWVLFDAEQQLLGEVSYEPTLSELAYQYTHATRLTPRLEAVTLLADTTAAEAREVMPLALQDTHWSVRETALGYYADAAAADFVAVEPVVRQLARADPEASVRAAALGALAERYEASPGQIEALARTALSDSSFTVVAVALDAYLRNDPPDAPEAVAYHARFSDLNVATVVGNYYAEARDPQAFDWFERRVGQGGTADKYYLLQQFGQYLMNLPDEALRRRGSERLGRSAAEESNRYVRYAAYQALGLLTDVVGVPALRARLRQQERDPRLRAIYEAMP